jgi:hypothetical protein
MAVIRRTVVNGKSAEGRRIDNNITREVQAHKSGQNSQQMAANKVAKASNKQAHKVCVGQNELVMSLLEDFGLNLTLK